MIGPTFDALKCALEELRNMRCQHGCDCGHPACKTCRDTKSALVAERRIEAAIAAAESAPDEQRVLDSDYCLETMSADELRAYDWSHALFIAEVNRVLDGKDDGHGVCNEPWQSLRKRLLDLGQLRAVNAELKRAASELVAVTHFSGCIDGATADARDNLERILNPKATLAEHDDSPPPTPFDPARLADALRGLDTALAQMFWTTDNGAELRNGTPEDGDAPNHVAAPWKAARQILAEYNASLEVAR